MKTVKGRHAMRYPLWAFVLVFTVLIPTRAPAWHKDGHMAVARIAWEKLTDGERAAAIKILKGHKQEGLDHFTIYLNKERPANIADSVSEIEWAFARAAAWPDWV